MQEILALGWKLQAEENNWVSVILMGNIWESSVKLFRNFACHISVLDCQQWSILLFKKSQMYTLSFPKIVFTKLVQV